MSGSGGGAPGMSLAEGFIWGFKKAQRQRDEILINILKESKVKNNPESSDAAMDALVEFSKAQLAPSQKGSMNSYEWVESLRRINCMEKENFLECFGKADGSYLWDKFVNAKSADIFSFLCYLDSKNTEKIYSYCLGKIRND